MRYLILILFIYVAGCKEKTTSFPTQGLPGIYQINIRYIKAYIGDTTIIIERHLNKDLSYEERIYDQQELRIVSTGKWNQISSDKIEMISSKERKYKSNESYKDTIYNDTVINGFKNLTSSAIDLLHPANEYFETKWETWTKIN